MFSKIMVPVWAMPILLLVGIGLGIGVGHSSWNQNETQTKDRKEVADMECGEISGSTFRIVVDSRMNDPVDYVTRYNAETKETKLGDDWKNHTSVFTFRNENTAKRVNGRIASVIREEIFKATKED